MNQVTISGNLTRDPEIKFLPTGMALCKFSVAVSNRWKDKSGEWKDDTCFTDVTAWGPLAEKCGHQLNKGHAVLVEGKLKQENWTTDDGQKRSKISVTASEVYGLQVLKSGADQKPVAAAQTQGSLPYDDDVPF